VYDFPFIIIELSSLALTVEALQGKTRQNSLLYGWVSQFEPKFQGERVVPREYFLASSKLDTFCYPTVQTAPCYEIARTGLRLVGNQVCDLDCVMEFGF